jgi:hypothetical protein
MDLRSIREKQSGNADVNDAKISEMAAQIKHAALTG